MTTQFAKASYQEIIDLHTESDKVSVIGIHTPTSDTPRKMFGGFFDQFKKFKYLGCSISLVPAARLPADPMAVSYEPGETQIDPRDLLNPLMFHGCHGNDMGVILNRLYALNSIDAKKMDSVFQYEVPTDANYDIAGFQLEDLYYKALTDNTWKKAHPQRGFRKSGLRPLVYSLATSHQLLGASALKINNGNVIMNSTQGLPEEMEYEVNAGETMDIYSNTSAADLRFFTPRLTGLGWLDTRNAITQNVIEEDVPIATGLAEVKAAVSQLTADQQSEPDLPLVYMGMILLPPAYKTEQYFRMIVNHHFAFKDFRGISFSNTLIDTPAYANFNDDDWTQGGDEVDPDDPGSGGDSGGGDDPGDDPDDPPVVSGQQFILSASMGTIPNADEYISDYSAYTMHSRICESSVSDNPDIAVNLKFGTGNDPARQGTGRLLVSGGSTSGDTGTSLIGVYVPDFPYLSAYSSEPVFYINGHLYLYYNNRWNNIDSNITSPVEILASNQSSTIENAVGSTTTYTWEVV